MDNRASLKQETKVDTTHYFKGSPLTSAEMLPKVFGVNF